VKGKKNRKRFKHNWSRIKLKTWKGRGKVKKENKYESLKRTERNGRRV